MRISIKEILKHANELRPFASNEVSDLEILKASIESNLKGGLEPDYNEVKSYLAEELSDYQTQSALDYIFGKQC